MIPFDIHISLAMAYRDRTPRRTNTIDARWNDYDTQKTETERLIELLRVRLLAAGTRVTENFNTAMRRSGGMSTMRRDLLARRFEEYHGYLARYEARKENASKLSTEANQMRRDGRSPIRELGNPQKTEKTGFSFMQCQTHMQHVQQNLADDTKHMRYW